MTVTQSNNCGSDLGSDLYKACAAVAMRNFEPQDMKLITAVLFLIVILVISMERKKKVKIRCLSLKNIYKYYNPGTVNEMCLFEDFNLTD